ncbi:hypothetical protein E4U43_007823 [Claviceps pusilla]|uniref:Uncharacterized protein n=1 Tax=Claviceps pusilla TaxID=123648 RepID=A0A9P7T1C0_9HYPO|nr:hypothetical protein E4U43_007823 [Claviceps pusilla]
MSTPWAASLSSKARSFLRLFDVLDHTPVALPRHTKRWGWSRGLVVLPRIPLDHDPDSGRHENQMQIFDFKLAAGQSCPPAPIGILGKLWAYKTILKGGVKAKHHLVYLL